jgi:hypothetical protein
MNPQTPVPVPQKHIPRGAIITVVVLIVLCVAGYGVFAMTATTGNLLSAIDQRGKGPRTHVELVAAIMSPNKDISGSALTFSMDTDHTDSTDPSLQGRITLATPALSAGADLKIIHKVFYARLNDIPDAYRSYAQSFLGKWFSVTLDSLTKYEKQNNVAVVSPEYATVDPAKKYAELIKAGVISDVRFAGIGSRNGKLERLYSISFDMDALKAYLGSKVATTTDSQAAGLNAKYLDQLFSAFSLKSVVAGVGFFDGKLDDMEYDVAVRPAAASIPASSMDIHVSIRYSDVAQDVVFAAPTDATSLDASLFQANADAQAKSSDATIKSDLMTMRVQAEIYYDKNAGYKGFCGSSDASVRGLVEVLAKEGATMMCRDSASAYVVTATLRSGTSTGTRFCVDSTGLSATLTKDPLGFSCK